MEAAEKEGMLTMVLEKNIEQCKDIFWKGGRRSEYNCWKDRRFISEEYFCLCFSICFSLFMSKVNYTSNISEVNFFRIQTPSISKFPPYPNHYLVRQSKTRETRKTSNPSA